MTISKTLIRLCWLIVLFVLTYSALGLFYQNGGSPFTFTTLRGQSVDIYGQGIYRYDTIFFSAGFRGNDAVTVFLEIPLLIIAIVIYGRGSLRGGFLLADSLATFSTLHSRLRLARHTIFCSCYTPSRFLPASSPLGCCGHR